MAKKRHTTEEVVSKWQQVDVLMAQGRPVAKANPMTFMSSAAPLPQETIFSGFRRFGKICPSLWWSRMKPAEEKSAAQAGK